MDRSFDDTQRMNVLADVAGAVAWAADVPSALRRVAELMVPRLADWCAVDVLENDATYQRLAVVHADAHWQGRVDALLGPWAADPDRLGVARVVRTGESQVAAGTPDAAALVPSDDAAREQLVSQLGLAGYVSVPLLFNARPFGALTLVAADPRRRFGDGDIALAETLARVAGLAVANSRLERVLTDTTRRQDDVLAALSHQLRTPLTAMLAWLNVARNPGFDGTGRAFDTIERNGRLLSRRIDELMDTARILTGKAGIECRPLDLAGIVQQAVMQQREAARHKGVRLDVELHPPGALCVGDRVRIEQIVVALIANGVKFTPTGGRIVACLDGDRARARIRVIDSGRGIPSELLPHVFDVFRRGPSAPDDPGLGLGLAMVRGLVRLHGGTVEASSAGTGRGATFTVLLPRAP